MLCHRQWLTISFFLKGSTGVPLVTGDGVSIPSSETGGPRMRHNIMKEHSVDLDPELS